MNRRAEQRVRLGLLVLVMVVFSVAFTTAGYGYYVQQRNRLDSQVEGDLKAVCALKAQHVADWLAGLDSDADANSRSPYFAAGIQRFLDDPSSAKEKLGLHARLLAELSSLDLRSICVLDPKLRKRLEAGAWCTTVGPDVRAHATEAVRTGKVVLTDLYTSRDCGRSHLDVIIPIGAKKGPPPSVRSVVLERVDPNVSLFPKLAVWPGPSRTAETMLVGRSKGALVLLSEPRYAETTPLARPPLSSPGLGRALATADYADVLSAVDYRGVKVLAAVRRVPGSPWFIVTKLDREEFDRPVRQQAEGTVSVAVSVLLMAGLSVGLLWRGQTSQFYKQPYQAELERHELAWHVEYLTKYANDIILLADEDLKIVDTNERAVDAYGRTREELLAMHVLDLRAPEARAGFSAVLLSLNEADGVVYETVHQRKDKTTFPVESSARLVTTEGRQSYQFIIRDITERKAAQRQLEEHQRKLRALASELSLAEERERRRLAIGLHDEVSQSLAMAKIRLGALCESATEPGMADGLKELSDVVDSTIKATRSLTFELSPPILYELGLEAAIWWLAEQMTERHGLACVVEDDEQSKPLRNDLRVLLFTAVRELLVNIVKHAHATEARIRICREKRTIQISVTDNGIGFDSAGIGSPEHEATHFGLFSIRERLDHLGGALVVDSQPGVGTMILLAAPLKRARRLGARSGL